MAMAAPHRGFGSSVEAAAARPEAAATVTVHGCEAASLNLRRPAAAPAAAGA
jgi:hypothetical protein